MGRRRRTVIKSGMSTTSRVRLAGMGEAMELSNTVRGMEHHSLSRLGMGSCRLGADTERRSNRIPSRGTEASQQAGTRLRAVRTMLPGNQEGMAGIRRSHITAHSMDMISMGSRVAADTVAAVMEDNRTIHLHPRSSNIRMHTEGKASISTISSIKRIRDSRRMRRAGTVGPAGPADMEVDMVAVACRNLLGGEVLSLSGRALVLLNVAIDSLAMLGS